MSKQTKNKGTRAIGRPTEYRAEFTDFAHKYLSSCKDIYADNRLQVHLPSVEGFAAFIGVSRDTLYEWAEKHKEFSDTLERLKQEQHQRLVNSGLSGVYNATIAKLMLTSNHGYSEKLERKRAGPKTYTYEQFLKFFSDRSDNKDDEDDE